MEIAHLFPDFVVEIRKIETKGDRVLGRAPSEIGEKGLFTEELERALLREDIDMAVHSLKDLPTVLSDGLEIGAFGRREDARDCLVSLKYASFEGLPKGARIGTSSLRRRSELLSLRPDLDVADLRGNVETRVKKLERGDFDAILIAAAGMIRLGLKDRITEIISAEKILPAPGQGIVAVETKTGRDDLTPILAGINNEESEIMAKAERELLKTFEGGCHVPVGALASLEGGAVSLNAYIGSVNGRVSVRDSISGRREDVVELGRGLAQRMIHNFNSSHRRGEVR